jgi:proteasome lid subunit RPN8/RPN11
VSEGQARIALGPRPIADLAEAIEAAGSQEACGVLLGRTGTGGGAVVVEAIVPTRNAFAGAGGFVIPDAELRRASLAARRLNLEVVGIYHGHPGGGVALSPADREAMVRSPLPWLVVTRDAADPARPAVKLTAYAPRTGGPMVVERAS